MHFSIDWQALIIICFVLPLVRLIETFFFPKNQIPSAAFSQVNIFEKISPGRRVKLAFMPKYLYLMALICFLLALVDPHFEFSQKNLTQKSPEHPITVSVEGLAIYLVLDRSGSMNQKVFSKSRDGKNISIPKIDLLKQFTEKFIREHSNDLIGIISFARVPRILVPLTLDQSILLHELEKIKVVTDPNEDGTALGYAIFKAANLIAATRHFAEELNSQGNHQYDIQKGVIIAITDGMQDPSHLDEGNRLRTMGLDEAAEYVKKQDIRLYIVNIDPIFSTEEFAPHRRQLQSITQLTGGQFYLADEGQNLQEIYNHINALEKSNIPLSVIPDQKIRYFSFYPYLTFAGLIFFLVACILESTYLKLFP